MKILFITTGLIITLLAACSHQEETATPSTNEPTEPIQTQTEQASPKPQEPKAETKAPAVSAETKADLDLRVITLDAGNLYFNPKNLALKVNQPVKINFTNKGTHTFTIDELGVDLPLASAMATVTFTPKKTGTFPIYCAVPGHRDAGMVGTVVVE